MAQYKEEQELRAEADESKISRIRQLEKELKDIKDASLNNSAAADILTGLISKGHLKQNLDGSVSALQELSEFDKPLPEDDKEF